MVLAFPCNQFGGQAGGTDAEIDGFACDEFQLPDDFRLMRTVKVKGADASAVFKFLVAAWTGRPRSSIADKVGQAVLGASIKWNFTKFLLNADGVPVERYGPMTSPKKIRKDAERLLTLAAAGGAGAAAAAATPVTPTALAAPEGLGGVECG